MRNFILLSIIYLLSNLSSSCTNPEKFDRITSEENPRQLITVEHYTYENHEYLFFYKGNGKFRYGGITHNPNCKCNNYAY